MKRLLTCVVLTLAALAATVQPASAAVCASTSATAASASSAQLTQATLCLLNQERAKRGLRPLRSNKRLAAAARSHAADMVRRDYFSHVAPGGTDFVTRIRRAGYRGSTLGEILAAGSGELATPAATVRGWMNSPGHRRNILHPRFREAGVGVVAGAPTLGGSDSATYTMTFGAR